MADEQYAGPGDANTQYTDVTGGVGKNFSVVNIFKRFGYYPTQDEVNALGASFQGPDDSSTGKIGLSAVSQYVLQKRAEVERQKNDPLVALQKKMEDSVALMKNQVQGLYGQLQDVLSDAPKLFGNLTPDQINEYLAPLKTSFDEQTAKIQGIMGSRGIAASSTENNALALTDQRFKENVLSTGLQVGLDAQKNKAQSIQQQIQNLFGLTGQEEGTAAAAAGQRSAQNLGQSNLIASLPYFLQQSSQQQQLVQKQMDSGGGFWDTFNKVTSGINQGMNAFESLAMIPSQFKTAPGGGGGGAPNAPTFGPNLPSNGMQTSTAGSELPALFATA